MNRRLVKEFRSLQIPWVIALGAAALMSIRFGCDPLKIYRTENLLEPGALASLALEASPSLFFASLALASALSFGGEFQHRTLSLLLSLPVPRSRIWREKLLALFAVITVSVSVYGLGILTLHQFLPMPPVASPGNLAEESSLIGPALLAAVFLLATACSAGFWSMVARSTIGGMALNAGSQFVLLLGIMDVLDRLYGPDLSFDDSRNFNAIACAGSAYAAVFLWLGWRRFATAQLTFGMAGEGMPRTESFAGLRLDFNWLRCRTTGGLANLLRKEVRLNKPVFLVATVFSICWLLALGSFFLPPRRRETFDMIFNTLTAVYVPVLFLLAGCASLGEEKSLGLNIWQLTLPIAAWRQWLVKLAVSAILAGALGLAIPWLLSCVTALKTDVGLHQLFRGKDNGLEAVLFGCSSIFLVSFWASTLLNNTISAAVAAIAAFPVFLGCALLAQSWAASFTGLLSYFLSLILAHFQLPSYFFLEKAWLGGAYFILIPLALTLLLQSLLQFRRSQPRRWVLLRYAATTGVLAFCLFLCQATFATAALDMSNDTGLRYELKNAILALPRAEIPPLDAPPRQIALKELKRTGRLAFLADEWLRNSSISIAPIHATRRNMQGYLVTVVFPNGRSESITFEGPANPPR